MSQAESALAASGARSRRSRHEVHELILNSARILFAEKGFSNTTTKEIAEHAGVHEPMVYRRFESKGKLFEAAVLVPFDRVVSSYLEAQQAQVEQPAHLEDLVRAFVEPLYDLFVEHHDLALALVAGHGLAPETVEGNGADEDPPLVRLLRRMEPQLQMEASRRGLRVDSPGTVLTTVGMVLGLALIERTALRRRPGWISRRRLVDEAVNMIMLGIAPREEPSGQTRSSEFVLLLERAIDAERRAARAELEVEQLRSARPGPQ